MDALTQLKNTVDGVVKTNGKQGITGANLQESLNTMIDTLGNGVTETTYAALKTLRDAGELTPGMWYRITDYTCITSQSNTRSAGHQFDILVLATSAGTLSEDALAAHHSGDTYFADSKLEAWKLKYCLDNNTSRFGWVNAATGKGVVWWMRDEWDNECFYDFKNIQFFRQQVTHTSSPFYSTDFYCGGAYGDDDTFPCGVSRNQLGSSRWCYTFSLLYSGETEYKDASLKMWMSEALVNYIVSEMGGEVQCVACGNHIGGNWRYWDNNQTEYMGSPALWLSRNVFYSYLFVDEDNDDYDVQFSVANEIGANSDLNTFAARCKYNKAGDCFTGNVLGANCLYNTFGNNVWLLSMVANCQYCTFGTDNKWVEIKQETHYLTVKSGAADFQLSANGPGVIRNLTIKEGITGPDIIVSEGQTDATLAWTYASSTKGVWKLYCEADLS